MRSQRQIRIAPARQRRERRSPSLVGRLGIAITALLAVCGVAIATSGGSYALWNSQTTVSPGTITSGSASIRVDDGTNAPLAFSSTPLLPGVSGFAVVKVENTGIVPLDLTISGTTVDTTVDTAGLHTALTLGAQAFGSAAECTAANMTAPSSALSGFSTPAAPPLTTLGTASDVSAGPATAYLCLRLTLDPAAPTTLQGATTNFTVSLLGTQRIS